MPLSTRTIRQSIEWAKRLSFNRNPVLGNSLEPALTSATLVMQVILGAPFEWWWNSQELVFTANPTANTATSTTASVTAGVLTVTAPNTFAVQNLLIISAFTGTLAPLNGQIITVLTATGSGFTAAIQSADLAADTTGGIFTNVTTQDYTIPAPTFSHIEHASLFDLSQVVGSNPPVYTPTKWQQLTVKNNLALESALARPQFISPEVEDGNGNVTFRLASSPDKPYPVSIHVQLAAPVVTSMNQTWAPLPDFMQYIYDWGFLALMWQFADDPRAGYANSQFKAALLGRAEGLTEEEKNIFLNNWEALQEGYAMKLQQGIQARQS
jgi:hypothetical protein